MLRSDQNADPDHEKNGREQSSMAVCCLRMVTSPDEAERFAQAQGVNTSTAARKPGYTPGFLFDSFGSGSVQTAPASACRSGLRAYAGDETAAGSSVSDQLTNILRPAGAGRKTGFTFSTCRNGSTEQGSRIPVLGHQIFIVLQNPVGDVPAVVCLLPYSILIPFDD